MTRRDEGAAVNIALDPFVIGSIEGRFGADPARAVAAALRHYERRLRSGNRPPEVPLFMRGIGVDRATAVELEVPVAAGVSGALGREAARQGVELDRLAAHAAFVFLDDLKGDGGAKENGRPLRYPDHAIQAPGTRRPRGTLPDGRLVRRGGGAGGHSRFGRR